VTPSGAKQPHGRGDWIRRGGATRRPTSRDPYREKQQPLGHAGGRACPTSQGAPRTHPSHDRICVLARAGPASASATKASSRWSGCTRRGRRAVCLGTAAILHTVVTALHSARTSRLAAAGDLAERMPPAKLHAEQRAGYGTELIGQHSVSLWTRTFHDPEGSKRVGLIVDIPDLAAYQEFMQTEAAADAMKHDGVRPETLLVLSEG
jgi:hypothetical protein